MAEGGCPEEAGYKPAPTPGRDADGGGLAGGLGALGCVVRHGPPMDSGPGLPRTGWGRLTMNGGWAGLGDGSVFEEG